jgi:hypothetical protein
MASLVLPTNYAYVALTAAGTLWLNLFQVLNVSKARKAVRGFYCRIIHFPDTVSCHRRV